MDSATGWEDVRLELSAGVARITLCRAARRNAMRTRSADELLAALRAAETGGARAVLLTGEGAAFGAGYDLSTLSGSSVERS